jgi:hypothetical protein
VCTFVAQPEFKFFSSSDVSSSLLGVSCRRLEETVPGFSPTAWWRFWKLLRVLEGFPW